MFRKFNDALVAFQKSPGMTDDKAESHYWIGVSHHQLGQSSVSCENLKIAAELGDLKANEAYLNCVLKSFNKWRTLVRI